MLFRSDDAIYVAGRLLQLLSRTDKTLSELKAEIPKYYSTPEIRLEAESDELKFDIAKKAENYFSSNYDCITVDGVRVKFDGGWGLVRASNTQPVIVCRFEGNTPEKMSEIQELMLNKLNEFGKLEVSSH